MSRVVWAERLVPGSDPAPDSYLSEYHGGVLSSGKVQRLEVETGKVKLPDPRVMRSVSRAAVLMASVCLEAKSFLDPILAEDPYSVGVYAAIENGPVDYPSVSQMRGIAPAAFAEKYRALRNPKMYLKQLPNLAAAQMGIFLGIRGPMNVFTHSTMAGRQALAQADSDLEAGEVKWALVCSATGFEDPLAVMRASREAGDRVLCEGAACVLLARSGEKLERPRAEAAARYFGIGDEIFKFAYVNEGAPKALAKCEEGRKND